jgi:hypothetical protein
MAKELEDLANEGTPVSEAGKEYLSGRAQRFPDEAETIGYVVSDRLPPEELIARMGGGGPYLIE